jgi:Flp pilus assembly protein TadG
MECTAKTSVSKNAAGPKGLAAKRRLRQFVSDGRAASIVEFALVMPIFLLLLGAAVDFGAMVRTKMLLSSAVSAAADYAIANATLVESTDGPTLAQTLASLMASANGTANWANSYAQVNYGPAVTISAGASTATGTAANANLYYCPTGSLTNTTPGTGTASSQSCGGSSSLYGGKYIVLQASRNFSPLLLPLSMFNLPSPYTISATSVVQVQ